MGTGDGASEKSKHNPDGENLKSLLKKSSGKKDKKSGRVVFNETKNEYFDADYIILIREECDFDDEDDDGVCTCYQHEMVRLTCCEPDCNCGGVYEELEVENQTPQSPKFAPPIEFVDAVTLSPPEGYKDMELEEMAYKQMSRNRAQRTAVCRECSANQEHEGEKGDNCQINSDINKPKIDLDDEDDNEKEKIDQSQQTTPTSPNNSDGKDYLLESSVDEDQASEENIKPLPASDSPVTGILKGGKLWRQQSGEHPIKANEQLSKTDSISDEESTTRTVRFIEEEKKDSCKSSPENDREVEGRESTKEDETTTNKHETLEKVIEPSEMMLTFKLGNHVLISNNSLKPNSAVRQLFPCTKTLPKVVQDEDQQYLVTAESLKAFEEAKRSKLPQIIQNAGTTDTIKRVIERNTLRRSLVRYEPKIKKTFQKTDNSLVERIKQLTCDIDDVSQDSDDLSARVSPTGEEGNNTDTSQISNKIKEPRNFSPSSSSTASSNSSSMSSTYKKITDLFGKRERPMEGSPQSVLYEPKTVQTQTLPDIAGPYNQEILEKDINKPNGINENRKQFLSTLAPLTACVSGVGHPEDHYYHLSSHGSVISSTGSEYTLDDIDEALVNEENKKITPDVLAGTPASESGDELVVFVQQDANRIERIKKKYENDNNSKKDDDENDDYGFNHRPSVRGIKPRFGSTTEILQQIQNQIQLPPTNANIAWPYYSETSLNRDDDSNRINAKQNTMTQYQIPDEAKIKGYQYRPVSLHENYQNCGNQTCYKDVYKAQIGVEVDCQTLPKYRNSRPLSPPPQEISRTYHQTMVYIPYNHIESYQPPPYQNEYYRYSQNQINKKYIEPVYQQKMQLVDDQYCNTNGQPKVLTKSPYQNSYQPMLVPSRSESPLMSNYSMARSTQTSVGCMSGCSFYQVPSTLRYRDSLRPPYKPDYVNKVQRHSFPSVRPRYNSTDAPEHTYIDEGSIQHSNHLNGYYNYLPPKESPVSSPTKARFIERGVPEGAASVSPQDSVNLQNSSTNTSPTSVPHATAKPIFYAMNV